MKLIVAKTYEEMSKQVADDLVTIMQSLSQPLLCTASGDSPAGLYKELTIRSLENDFTSWRYVGLDEWVGMNGEDEGSCRDHLNKQLFHPLKVKDKSICFFDGKKENPEAECTEVERFVEQQGGIDVTILGLGMNGHVGLNEPGTSTSARSHITDLDELTKKTAQKYFNGEQKLSKGITLGMATLLESKYIFLLVSGKHKASIVKEVIEGPVTEELPASLLKTHPRFRIYLTADAAELILSMD